MKLSYVGNACNVSPSRRGFVHDGIIKIGEEQYACKVSNMSAAGAVLSFIAPIDLPARFTLLPKLF